MRKTRKLIGGEYFTPRGVKLTRNHFTLTEAEFFAMIRFHARKLSMRWIPRQECLKQARRPSTGSDKRVKWEYECAICKKWWKAREVEVDHIIPCGSLKTFDDIGSFFERMLCEIDGLRVLCKGCHKEVTWGE